MKITPKVKLDIIIAHFEEQKWFLDEIAKIAEANAIDLAVWKEMRDREPEWNGGPLNQKKQKYAAVLAEVRAKIAGGA